MVWCVEINFSVFVILTVLNIQQYYIAGISVYSTRLPN